MMNHLFHDDTTYDKANHNGTGNQKHNALERKCKINIMINFQVVLRHNSRTTWQRLGSPYSKLHTVISLSVQQSLQTDMSHHES